MQGAFDGEADGRVPSLHCRDARGVGDAAPYSRRGRLCETATPLIRHRASVRRPVPPSPRGEGSPKPQRPSSVTGLP